MISLFSRFFSAPKPETKAILEEPKATVNKEEAKPYLVSFQESIDSIKQAIAQERTDRVAQRRETIQGLDQLVQDLRRKYGLPSKMIERSPVYPFKEAAEAAEEEMIGSFSELTMDSEPDLEETNELQNLEVGEVPVEPPMREPSEELKNDSEVEEDPVFSSESESEAEEPAAPIRQRRTADREIVGQRNAILADWLRPRDRVDYSKYF